MQEQGLGGFLNRLLDYLSEQIARRRGLPVLLGVGLVLLNFIFQFIPGLQVLTTGNFLLHLGVVVGLLGILLGDII
ncbi:MAG: hypothetical protein B6I34_00190 [Anaerolineaceae bacterium 4572_32.1]|nr:MAG: hypothetical protein B6I34_00190 [Anaerolineaceae bacterium 4572_32.1]